MTLVEMLNAGLAWFQELAQNNPSLALGLILAAAGFFKRGALGAAAFLGGLYFILHNFKLDTVFISALKSWIGL